MVRNDARLFASQNITKYNISEAIQKRINRARRNASRLLTNVDILESLQKRKAYLAELANVAEKEVLGKHHSRFSL